MHLTEPFRSHVEIKRCRQQTRMTHQTLHQIQFHAAFDQVSGKTVATITIS